MEKENANRRQLAICDPLVILKTLFGALWTRPRAMALTNPAKYGVGFHVCHDDHNLLKERAVREAVEMQAALEDRLSKEEDVEVCELVFVHPGQLGRPDLDERFFNCVKIVSNIMLSWWFVYNVDRDTFTRLGYEGSIYELFKTSLCEYQIRTSDPDSYIRLPPHTSQEPLAAARLRLEVEEQKVRAAHDHIVAGRGQFARSDTAAPRTHRGLLDLPAELRIAIYQNLHQLDHEILIVPHNHKKPFYFSTSVQRFPFALTQVCSKVRQELFYELQNERPIDRVVIIHIGSTAEEDALKLAMDNALDCTGHLYLVLLLDGLSDKRALATTLDRARAVVKAHPTMTLLSYDFYPVGSLDRQKIRNALASVDTDKVDIRCIEVTFVWESRPLTGSEPRFLRFEEVLQDHERRTSVRPSLACSRGLSYGVCYGQHATMTEADYVSVASTMLDLEQGGPRTEVVGMLRWQNTLWSNGVWSKISPNEAHILDMVLPQQKGRGLTVFDRRSVGARGADEA